MLSTVPKAIYLETSTLLGLPTEIANAEFQEMARICRDQNISIVVPQLVIDELTYHRICTLKDTIQNLERTCKRKVLRFAKPDFEIAVNEEELIGVLRGKIKSTLVEHSITIAGTPDLDIKELLRMAVEKIPPFKKKGEKGFRDSVIMFTIINFAKANFAGTQQLLISNDPDFCEEEVLQRFESEGISIEISDSLATALEDMGKVLGTDYELGKTWRLEKLRLFLADLERESKRISKYVFDTLKNDPQFPLSILGVEQTAFVDSLKSVVVDNFHKLTPGMLPEGETEGKVKVSFSARVKATFNMLKFSYQPAAYVSYGDGLVASDTEAATASGFLSPSSCATPVSGEIFWPRYSTNRASGESPFIRFGTTASADVSPPWHSVTIAGEPWPTTGYTEVPMPWYSTASGYTSRQTYEKDTITNMAFEANAHLKKEGDDEIYSELIIERILIHPQR